MVLVDSSGRKRRLGFVVVVVVVAVAVVVVVVFCKSTSFSCFLVSLRSVLDPHGATLEQFTLWLV